MIHLLNNLLHGWSGTVFGVSAIIGTTLFAIRMFLSFLGGSFDHDNAFESYDEGHHHGTSFKLLTLHSISGFLMAFGWVGLACERQLGFSSFAALGFAVGAGLSMLILVAGIMKAAMLLESPGSVFSSQKAVGLVGVVYHRIPEHGHGKIHVVVDNIQRELLAQSQNNKILESFTLIKVVKIIDSSLVEVIAFQEDPTC